MPTSATFLKARSTAAAKVYEITSTSPDDTDVSFPNDFGTEDVLVQIEPAAAGEMPADYLASDWRISDDTTAEEIVLRKTPGPASASGKPQAVAVVTRLARAE